MIENKFGTLKKKIGRTERNLVHSNKYGAYGWRNKYSGDTTEYVVGVWNHQVWNPTIFLLKLNILSMYQLNIWSKNMI